MLPRALASLVIVGLACAASTVDAAPKRQATHHKKKHQRRHPHPRIYHHGDRRLQVPAEATDSAAYRYGTLTAEACEAELASRGIPVSREPSPGVLDAVRLAAPLHGVTFRGERAEAGRATSTYERVDCRLVLALDDFAVILARHDIVEVRHYSMYRPPGAAWPEGRLATRHPGALAIDVARFIRADGTWLGVLRDFHGHIGARTCGGRAAPHPATKDALELRAILCEALDAHLFNVVLTPNHNRPHRNHFHMEVTAGVRWFLYD